MVCIFPSFHLSALESRDLSQAEKKTTVAKAEKNLKKYNYFHSKLQLLAILSENKDVNLYQIQQQSVSLLRLHVSLKYISLLPGYVEV